MTGPGWLAAGFAGLMLLIAAACAGRLAIWQLRGRDTEPEADGLHVLMGVAMAGMLEPRLIPVPAVAWRAVFAGAAAWFAWQAIRARSRRQPSSSSWRCVHPAPHAVECGAMIYMLMPTRPTGHGSLMAMPGMGGAAAAANPALVLVLALFMLGYILWTTDQLAALSRARVAAASTDTTVSTVLAPRFAACYKIAMSVAMGYMLITML